MPDEDIQSPTGKVPVVITGFAGNDQSLDMSLNAVRSLSILCALSLLLACQKKDTRMKAVQCSRSNYYIYFLGYTSRDIKQVEITTTPANGQPSSTTTIDLINTPQASNSRQHGDTLLTGIALHPDHAQVIRALPLGRTWSIDSVTYYSVTQAVPEDMSYFFNCPFSAYVIDGQRSTFAETGKGPAMPFILLRR